MDKLVASSVFKPAYLSSILDSIDESVVATDENSVIQYWNKGAEQTFGYSSDEAIGMKQGQILRFHYSLEKKAKAREMLKAKGQWKCRSKVTTKNNDVLLLDVFVRVVKNRTGRVVGYVGVYKDITESDQTKESLATFTSLISSLDDDILVVDKKLRVAFITGKTNTPFNNIFGTDYLLRDHVVSKLPGDSKKLVEDCFKKALGGEKNNYQVTVKKPGEKYRWLDVNYFPIKDIDGCITHACCLVRDITAQKEMEEVNLKLHSSKKLFQTFMENGPILSWITDSKNSLCYLNSYSLKSYSLQKNVIGKTVDEVLPEPVAAAFKENNENIIRLHESVEIAERPITMENHEHIYHVIKFPIFFNNETYIGGWALDITEEINLRKKLMKSLGNLKNSEAELKQSLAKEHLLNDMKSRFVSMASHEFRTPLSTILSSAFLLEKYTTTEQQTNRQKHISRIRESISHLNALLEDFLSLGRLEEGKIVVHHSAINLPGLISTVIEEMEPFKKPGQVVKYEQEGDTNITTDKKLLKNIINNLLNNAFKFSAENKTIVINSLVEKDRVIIRVKDEGIGISTEDQKHLFESFYRGKNAQNIQGTGLGLHIVKRYTRLLNGDIKLESKLSEGTTAIVTLQSP